LIKQIFKYKTSKQQWLNLFKETSRRKGTDKNKQGTSMVNKQYHRHAQAQPHFPTTSLDKNWLSPAHVRPQAPHTQTHARTPAPMHLHALAHLSYVFSYLSHVSYRSILCPLYSSLSSRFPLPFPSSLASLRSPLSFPIFPFSSDPFSLSLSFSSAPYYLSSISRRFSVSSLCLCHGRPGFFASQQP